MISVNVYNQKGEEMGQAQLPKEVFGLEVSPDLVRQVVVSQMANRRQGTAHTKDRREVSGGGKKPWRQKGTGRARHGSIRSPLWKGGGVTFGPRNERNYQKAIPAKMRKKALLMVLSAKAKNNLLVLLDELKLTGVKTKEIFSVLRLLPCKGKGTLIVLPEMDKNIIFSARNISGIATMQAKDLNALDLLSYKYLLMPEKAVETMKIIYGKS